MTKEKYLEKASEKKWTRLCSRLVFLYVFMVCYFIGVDMINRTLHSRLEIRNFSPRVEKYFTCSLRSLE